MANQDQTDLHKKRALEMRAQTFPEIRAFLNGEHNEFAGINIKEMKAQWLAQDQANLLEPEVLFQLNLLKQDTAAWNEWRKEHPQVKLNLRRADLHQTNLSEADLSGADLSWANLSEAILCKANLTATNFRVANLSRADLRQANLSDALLGEADLSEADLGNAELTNAQINDALLRKANLYDAFLISARLTAADLSEADLRDAELFDANLSYADLRGADLRGADLRGVNLMNADLRGANLTGCSIHGISAWNVRLENAIQSELIITPYNEPSITVDNLKIAQFIYLLLDNQEIRNVIDTITSKVVLILGRFTPKRKAILDALRDELRKYDYLPVVFDFDKPRSRNLTETVSTLAHMSRFIIADLTSAKSIPQELESIAPRLRVPIQPILQVSEMKPYSMFESFEDYPWVLPLYRYSKKSILLKSLLENVINPAEEKAKQLEKPSFIPTT